jgi:ABC-2 type transport system permease protein
VGSATDNETDSNQLILPISIPLIASLIVIASGISPQHELIRWLSFIPFTSPITMLYRIPSGVPLWELLLSGGLLLLTFFLCVGFAAKIYRIGLLTYGKKITWRELMRWLKL